MQKINNNLVFSKLLFPTVILLSAFVFVRCSTTDEKTAQADAIPANYKPEVSVAQTKDGFNVKPQLSKDGKWLLFIRSKTSEHQQAQLYIRDLTSGIDKRLTFQDGDVLDAQFDTTGEWIYFSSTTDELKENSNFIRDSLAKRNGTLAEQTQPLSFGGEPLQDAEIYRIHRNGMSIERMTQKEKFDGQVAPRPNHSEYFFVSLRSGKTQIYRQRFNSDSAEKFSAGQNVEQYPAFSSDGTTLAYVRKTAAGYELITGNVNARNWTKVFESAEPITDVGIHPNTNELYFITRVLPSEWRDLYIIQRDGQCLRRLTYDAAEEKHPTWNKAGDTIYFAKTVQNESHVHQMKFTPPTCPEPPAPIDLKQAEAVPAKTSK